MLAGAAQRVPLAGRGRQSGAGVLRRGEWGGMERAVDPLLPALESLQAQSARKCVWLAVQ